MKIKRTDVNRQKGPGFPTYYKISLKIDFDNEILHYENSIFTFGHYGWEKLDKVCTDGYSEASYKTEDKEMIPHNIEELLLECIHNSFDEQIKEEKEILKKHIKESKNNINIYNDRKNHKIFKYLNRKDKLKTIKK